MGIDVNVYINARPDASGRLVLDGTRFAYTRTALRSFGSFFGFNQWRECAAQEVVLPRYPRSDIDHVIHTPPNQSQIDDINERIFWLDGYGAYTILAMRVPARSGIPLLELVTANAYQGVFGPGLGRKLYTDLVQTSAWADRQSDDVKYVHRLLTSIFTPFSTESCIAVIGDAETDTSSLETPLR
jgi:hypothetical protein